MAMVGSTPTRFRQFSSRLACPPCRFSRPSQYRRSEGTFVLAKRRFLSYVMTPSPPPPPHHNEIFLDYSHPENTSGRGMVLAGRFRRGGFRLSLTWVVSAAGAVG